jgi:hypothetical protein
MRRHWPQLLLAASTLPMVLLAVAAAWTLFVSIPASHDQGDFGPVLVLAAIVYPLTFAMQVVATIGVYRQAQRGADEPTGMTKGLLGLSFLSLAGPVLVFLAYAVGEHGL